MQLSIRLHDAVDPETVLGRILPVLAGSRAERRVAYARYEPGVGRLTRRWTATEAGEVESAPVDLEPERLHSLLADDAMGDRPMRPVDSAPTWVLKDLIPGLDPDRYWVRARAIAHDHRWLGVLVVAEPRRWMLARRPEESADAGGDVLELCLARALVMLDRQSAEAAREQSVRSLAGITSERLRESERAAHEAQQEADEARRRADALERAAAHATEMLMEAHIEIDRKSQRHQRQTRVLYLLRKMLENHARGMSPALLAQEVVGTVSEAFGGGRCSLLLIDETGPDGPELRLAAGVGLPPEVEGEAVRIPMGSGVSGGVARSRVPVVVREPDESEPHDLQGDEWYTSSAFVSLPLVCRNHLLGVLNLTNFRAGTVDDFEVEQLRLVALCVGLLADHASLNQRLFEPVRQAAG
jgi:hypothetical protein